MMAQRADMNRPRFAENPANGPLSAAGAPDREATRTAAGPAKGGAPIAKKRRAMQRRILPVSQDVGRLGSTLRRVAPAPERPARGASRLRWRPLETSRC